MSKYGHKVLIASLSEKVIKLERGTSGISNLKVI